MKRCVNCGGKHLTVTQSGEFAKCSDCGCSNIIVRPEHRAAANKVMRELQRLGQEYDNHK